MQSGAWADAAILTNAAGISRTIWPMPTRFKIIGVAVVLAAALALTIYYTRWRTPLPSAAMQGRRGPNANQTIPVRAVAARAGSIDVFIDALGTVTARNTAVVHARVDGLLQKLNFQEGGEVKAGAVLAQLDARPLQAAYAQARGQLARDAALLDSARSDLHRYQGLLALDSIAKQQVDDQAALVRQYAGTLQSDRGNLANAKLQLDFTRITAPISGRAGLRQVDLGNMVHAADANGIVVVTQTKPINVQFAVPIERAPQITRLWQTHAELTVEALDRDGQTHLARGRVESVDNVVDPTTATVKIKAVFANDDGVLFPNQFVNARLVVTRLDNQTLIPASAVQRGSTGTFVYVVNPDSTVSVRAVELATTHQDVVAVAKGVAVAERVVVDGTDKLRDKARVEAAIEAPAAPKERKHHWPRGGAAP